MSELREVAVRAIANYMHQELFEITNSAEMLPFIREKSIDLLDIVDKSIELTKTHPAFKNLRG